MTTHPAATAATTSVDADPPLTLLSLPAPLLEEVLGLRNVQNCLAATHVNQRLRRVALDSVVRRAADPRVLCAVAERGSTVAVRALLQAGAHADAADAVARVCSRGQAAVLRLLVEVGGADVNKVDGPQGSAVPLHGAALSGDPEIVRFLLDNGADAGATVEMGGGESVVDDGSNDRLSALDIAVGLGKCDVVRLLLAAGVPPHPAAHHHATNAHPLLRAAKRGLLEIVDVLLEAGADPNYTCPPAGTPLHAAATLSHYDIVASLLQQGAAVDKAKEDGSTALHAAATVADAAMVRLLLGHGADVEALGPDKITPMMRAAAQGHCRGRDTEALQALLDAGGRVDAKLEPEDVTVLQVAAVFGHLDKVKVLLAAGASCSDRDASGRTALDYAMAAGHDAVADALRRGA